MIVDDEPMASLYGAAPEREALERREAVGDFQPSSPRKRGSRFVSLDHRE